LLTVILGKRGLRGAQTADEGSLYWAVNQAQVPRSLRS